MGLNVGVRHKNTTLPKHFTVPNENKHGQNSIWLKCRSATQKIDTTALFYCTKHGQNPTHPTDEFFTLKNRTEKAKRTSSSA
jgi:hypothetical protein